MKKAKNRLFLRTIAMIFIGILVAINASKLYYRYTNKQTSQNSKIIMYIMQHQYNPINIISKSLLSLDATIKNNIPLYHTGKSHADEIIEKSVFKVFYLRIIVQTIVCSVFLVDVLLFKQFNYFYKIVWLLLIPMLISYTIYSLEIYAKTNLNVINEMLNITIKSEEMGEDSLIITDVYDWYEYLHNTTLRKTQFTLTGEYSFKESYFLDNLQGKSFGYHETLMNNVIYKMTVLFKILTVVKIYRKYKENFGIQADLIRYLMYSIGWGYILLTNLL